MPLRVMLACNDPDNGNWTGKADMVEIEGIELEGRAVSVDHYPRKMRKALSGEGIETLRIGRCVVPSLGYRRWVGNWCWDCAHVRAMNALHILNYLVSRGWRCTAGTCEVADAIDAGKAIDQNTWKSFVQRGLLES